MSLSTSSQDESTSSLIYIEDNEIQKSNSNSSDDIELFADESSELPKINGLYFFFF
jgi:hypothetical protein